MKLKTLTLSLLAVLAASYASVSLAAELQSTHQQSLQTAGAQTATLGRSAVPYPASSGGLAAPVNNLGTPRTIGANGPAAGGAYPYGQYGGYAGIPYLQNGMMGTNYANGYAFGALTGQQPLKGQPAWSQGSYYADRNLGLLPFGASLFEGHFAGTYSDSVNPSYRIAPGDRIVIRIWGARQYDDVLAVDLQGNIFIPEVGPISVAGITNSQLQSAVKGRLGQIFTNNIEVYVNLLSAQPAAVFVTGFVNRPGQYAGGIYDSLLSYLDRAGGIDFARGSFREISVKRSGKVIASCDLYDFITEGRLPQIRLMDGDVIVVGQRSAAVSVRGLVREEALYETGKSGKGLELISLCAPENGVSHVSVSGTREQRPVNYYLSMDEFKNFVLADGDVVTFAADIQGQTLITKVSGAVEGLSHFPVNKDKRLRDLLSYIEIDPDLGDAQSIYIKRRSVAEQQKKTIQDALRRLEQSALTATSSSVDEAEIRVQEATLIQDFVSRASAIEPDGIVVVSRGGVVNDIMLEDGDEIVIPRLTDVVLVSGEVMMPKAVAWDESMSLDDYLGAAGGVSNRADDKNILVAKANGEVGLADDLGIAAGDQILVMPRFDSKNMQLAKDIMQILYQMAVATRVVVDL